MEKGTSNAPKPSARKAKKAPTHVKAEIEKRKFDGDTGERLSKSKIEFFTFVDWQQFCEHGPRQGWYVNKVITRLPEMKDYQNPSKKKKAAPKK